jgi:hypothetical protein
MKTSAYATTKDVLTGKYPVKECLNSVSNIVDEVIVFDSSRKNDGTREFLESLARENPKIKLMFDQTVDWSAPNHGIFDGQTKTKARELCSGDVLVQIDVDEVIHEKDYDLWKKTLKAFYESDIKVLATPVVEFWGSKKIRIDIGPTKERISRNLPSIIHGIPGQLRTTYNGLLYAKPGTDGCNMIDKQTLEMIPHYLPKVDFMPALRQQAMYNEDSNEIYSSYFTKNVLNGLLSPCVYHYSWYDIKRKIETYRAFWGPSWASLYHNDPKYNNPMFPGLTNESITDEMISEYASKIEEETAGWIFHSPWDGSRVMGVYNENMDGIHPKIMKEWTGKHV